jgi:hypothetical protein
MSSLASWRSAAGTSNEATRYGARSGAEAHRRGYGAQADRWLAFAASLALEPDGSQRSCGKVPNAPMKAFSRGVEVRTSTKYVLTLSPHADS